MILLPRPLHNCISALQLYSPVAPSAKSFKVFVLALSFIMVSVLPAINGTSLNTLSATQTTPAPDELSAIFNIAVAQEPLYFILVEKKHQRLRVLEYTDELRVIVDYPCATGEIFGNKEITGDLKTPEGIYFITRIFRDDEITIFGDKAFHLDYPNFFDQEAGRNGYGIYIHGTNRELTSKSTKGCVTLANSDLADLESYLKQEVTPVVIVQEITPATIPETQLLKNNSFMLAKSLLLSGDIKPAQVDYNYLYIISLGEQTVAVSDFIYRPFNNSFMRGSSRAYLKFISNEGWAARQRLWSESPFLIYPDSPAKIIVHPVESNELQLSK